MYLLRIILGQLYERNFCEKLIETTAMVKIMNETMFVVHDH